MGDMAGSMSFDEYLAKLNAGKLDSDEHDLVQFSVYLRYLKIPDAKQFQLEYDAVAKLKPNEWCGAICECLPGFEKYAREHRLPGYRKYNERLRRSPILSESRSW